MVKLFTLIGLIAALLCGNASAQNRELGLGVIVGEPDGLSAKVWTGGDRAFDIAAAWSSGRNGDAYLHADYLIHDFHLLKVENGELPFYYGIGGRINFESDSKIGIRIPAGIEYLFSGAPIGIFLEIVPLLNLAPDTDFRIKAGLGVRYYFQ